PSVSFVRGKSTAATIAMRPSVLLSLLSSAVLVLAISCSAQTPSQPNEISVDWNKKVLVSRSTPTLQVVVNPMLRASSPIHDGAFQALKDLGADYVRYVPWLPYPRLGVAELEPPTKRSTSWDFTLLDPLPKD